MDKSEISQTETNVASIAFNRLCRSSLCQLIELFTHCFYRGPPHSLASSSMPRIKGERSDQKTSGDEKVPILNEKDPQ